MDIRWFGWMRADSRVSRRIRATEDVVKTRARDGFSLIELIAVVGIVTVLIALTVPTIRVVRDHAKATECKSQLHQIGITVAAYASENRGLVIPWDGPPGNPGRRAWPEILFRTARPKVVLCPTAEAPEFLSYVMNMWLLNGRIRADGGNSGRISPSEIVLAGENWPWTNYEIHMLKPEFQNKTIYNPVRHGPKLRSNYLYLDFHVSNDPLRVHSKWDDWYIPRH
jgi:prepilin-type N-terminal cleavage/methylation domain-containing protein/prepilin-type processing-associated H-X9-DG protein